MKRANEKGFTLIELLVGIMVGAIVLTMSIAIIVSTNRTSVQLMSRQEASQSTRVALSQVLKSVGSAQSLLNCRVWSNQAARTQYSAYQAEVATLDPDNPVVTNSPPDPQECNEYFETGDVLVFIHTNAVCWNRDLTDGNSVINFSQPPEVACLVHPKGLGSANPPCVNEVISDRTVNSLIYYECDTTSSTSYFMESTHFLNSLFSYKPDSRRQLISFTPPSAEAEQFSVDRLEPRTIFSFERTDGSTHIPSNPRVTKNIETIYVNIDVVYRAAQGSGLDGEDFNIYRFSQKVLLQGARAFLEQGAYGGNYAG